MLNTKWLYAILLFISLYALPGYAGKMQVKQTHASQSEFIISPGTQANKRVAFYKYHTIPCKKVVGANLYRHHFKAVSFLHDREAKTLINLISKKIFNTEQVLLVYLQKICTPVSDPDFSSLV